MPRPANVSQLARIVCATLFHVRRGAFGSRANGTKRDHPLRSGAAGAFRVVRPGPTAPSAITPSAPRAPRPAPRAGSPVKPPRHQRARPTPVRPRPARRRREGVKTPGLCPRPRFFFGLCCGCDQRGPVPLFARPPALQSRRRRTCPPRYASGAGPSFLPPPPANAACSAGRGSGAVSPQRPTFSRRPAAPGRAEVGFDPAGAPERLRCGPGAPG